MNTKNASNTNFLYVEDDEANRAVVRMLLQNVMKMKCLITFEDSVDFMNKIQALPECPDIFLLDIQVMPLNGFEMLALLRAEPQYNNAKIIALTASVMNEEVAKLRSSGFDGAIGKPLRASTFPELISRIINGETIWNIS